jgi:hypothetical membrane protein
MKEKILVFALASGILVPILYFGTQLLAAPFFPDYNFLSMVASLLGSDLAPYPAIFNGGAIITGIVTIIASVGFLLAFQRLGINPAMAWLTSLAVLLNGLGSLWAGFFPMPDPRHGANPFTAGIFLFPILLTFALWNQRRAWPVKIYLIITNLLFIALIPIMSGVSGINTQAYQGLLQRIAALIFFVPISVGSYFLLHQIKGLSLSERIKRDDETTA